MATVILVRHGRTTANAAGVLAGRTPGVQLDDTGARAGRSAPASGSPGVRLAGDRHQPAGAVPADRAGARRGPGGAGSGSRTDARAHRVRLRRLAGPAAEGPGQGEALETVQAQPSAATFPGGESMAAMQARAVAAVRRHDARRRGRARRRTRSGSAVSHGDVIKAVLADALGMHLDLFQRIHVDPASVSIVRYTDDPALRARRPTPTRATWRWLRRRRPRSAVARRAATPRSAAAPVPASPARRRRHRVVDMPVVHRFDPPERFVAGTVGEPGARTFFLQARDGARLVSVALEKQQVAALAERIDELLDELMADDGRPSR